MIKSTTILAIRHKGQSVMVGDGQVTLNGTVMKHRAKKVRKLYHGNVIAGFAGTTADALNLFERFEAKLEQYNGNLTRAVVELARDWRSDKILRKLEALLIAVDRHSCFVISGNGDVIEPDDGVAAIGTGGAYASAAAKALVKHSKLDAKTIAEEAIRIAASICVFTNEEIVTEEL